MRAENRATHCCSRRSRRNKGPQEERAPCESEHYGAKAISVEKRTASGGKIIKRVNVAADAVSKFIDDLDLQ
jgi:hypothetical protein